MRIRTPDDGCYGVSTQARRPSNWPYILLLFATAALLLAPVTGSAREGATAFLPRIPLSSLAGGAVLAPDWLEGKPAVVNVWATWCPPCRTEMPSLQRLAALLEPQGIRVLALSVDSDHNLVREFGLKYGITLPIAIANSPSEAMASIKVDALPLTLYVGADGRILGRHIGQRDWSDDAVVREVRQRFAVRSTPGKR